MPLTKEEKNLRRRERYNQEKINNPEKHREKLDKRKEGNLGRRLRYLEEKINNPEKHKEKLEKRREASLKRRNESRPTVKTLIKDYEVTPSIRSEFAEEVGKLKKSLKGLQKLKEKTKKEEKILESLERSIFKATKNVIGRNDFTPTKSFKDVYRKGVLMKPGTPDVFSLVKVIKPKIKKQIKSLAKEVSKGENIVKVRTTIVINYENLGDKSPRIIQRAIAHKSNMYLVNPDNADQLDKTVKKMTTELMAKVFEKGIENTEDLHGSKWVVRSVERLEVSVRRYTVSRGSGWVPLPTFIKSKKACINIRNDDEFCFVWCILRHLNPKKINASRTTDLKPFFSSLNIKGLNFPLEWDKVENFSRRNKNLPPINLFTIGEKERIVPLSIHSSDAESSINLLFFKDENKGNHFALIKSLTRLVGSSVSKTHRKKYFCCNCLSYFTTKEGLDTHVRFCVHESVAHTFLEGEKATLFFTNFKAKVEKPLVIYADSETLSINLGKTTGETETISKLVPIAFGMKPVAVNRTFPIETFIAKTNEEVEQRTVVTEFLQRLITIISDWNSTSKFKKHNLSKAEENSFQNAKRCWICEERFLQKRSKVRDHDHFTGKFRGAAHIWCNLDLKEDRNVVVYFHNLTGFDLHLFVKELYQFSKNIRCIAISSEKYKSVSFYPQIKKKGERSVRILFYDTMGHLLSSLGKLVDSTLPSDLKLLKERFPNFSDLMSRKGVFPYEYIQDIETLKEEKLPPPQCFKSRLTKEEVSPTDYAFAQKVWKETGCKTLEDYLKLYLETDVLLLADVFEAYRKMGMREYGLDPSHFMSAPGLFWNAMLKETKVELTLFSDCDKLMFWERCKRGGLSMIARRFAEPTENECIVDLDVNNLYGGFAMNQLLPIEPGEWMSKGDLKNWRTFEKTEAFGCLLEVDLSYPKKLYKNHNDLPLAPEVRRPPGSREEKLLAHFGTRKNYVSHHLLLHFYEKEGLIIEKVHRGLLFNQKRFMAPYVNGAIERRRRGKNKIETDFHKLSTNSVFGKTMEDVRKRMDFRLVTTSEQAEKLFQKPNYEDEVVFSENLMGIFLKKTNLTFDKPLYVGATILELSKLKVQQLHHHLKKKFGKNLELLMTDTDSLVYFFTKSNNFFGEFTDKERRELFDLSNYPPSHPYFFSENKLIPGFLKDEMGGKRIKGFVGIRAKCYAMIEEEGKETKKSKGVNAKVIQNELTYKMYKEANFSGQMVKKTLPNLRSHNHDILLEETNKIAISPFDDKVIVLPDRIHHLCYQEKDF